VSPAESAPALALNIYCWGKAAQNELLTGFVAPEIRALREAGRVRRFWSTRFDSRGPHVMLVLTTPGSTRELEAHLGERLDAWLAEHPSTETLSPGELATRHEECRGKELCAPDHEPGIAPNNSYRFAPHSPHAYPFGGSPGADEFWELASEHGLWLMDRLREGAGTGLAVRWIADVDGALLRLGADAAASWRYHATTLLRPLAERLRTEEPAVLAALPGSVGERNREAFARVWDGARGAAPAWGPTARLVELALRADAGGFQLLREINHCALKTLDQPVLLHVPLVLYAWQRNLLPPGGLPAAGAPESGAPSTSTTTGRATAW